MKTTRYIIPVLALALFACHSTKKMEQQANVAATELSLSEKAGTNQLITEKYWKLIELDGQKVVRGEQ